MFHGVGTNGRQISMIAGGPQSKNGFETIMIDLEPLAKQYLSELNQNTKQ